MTHDDDQDSECPQCLGEGVVYECIDGCCLNAEEGCDLCERRCDWCRPKRPANDAELVDGIDPAHGGAGQ